MVFQSYALYPHMTNRDTSPSACACAASHADRRAGRLRRRTSASRRLWIAFPPALRRPAAACRHRPGHRPRPEVFLIDEPLSNLDAKLRNQMRAEIKSLHQRLGTTMVYVTHDQIEAMTLADRIVVMQDGVIQQIAAPGAL